MNTQSKLIIAAIVLLCLIVAGMYYAGYRNGLSKRDPVKPITRTDTLKTPGDTIIQHVDRWRTLTRTVTLAGETRVDTLYALVDPGDAEALADTIVTRRGLLERGNGENMTPVSWTETIGQSYQAGRFTLTLDPISILIPDTAVCPEPVDCAEMTWFETTWSYILHGLAAIGAIAVVVTLAK